MRWCGCGRCGCGHCGCGGVDAVVLLWLRSLLRCCCCGCGHAVAVMWLQLCGCNRVAAIVRLQLCGCNCAVAIVRLQSCGCSHVVAIMQLQSCGCNCVVVIVQLRSLSLWLLLLPHCYGCCCNRAQSWHGTTCLHCAPLPPNLQSTVYRAASDKAKASNLIAVNGNFPCTEQCKQVTIVCFYLI